MREALRSFLRGMAELLDIGGTWALARSREILERTDAEALASDWQQVGRDLQEAAVRFATTVGDCENCGCAIPDPAGSLCWRCAQRWRWTPEGMLERVKEVAP